MSKKTYIVPILPERVEQVSLTLNESGTLCNLLMRGIVQTNNPPEWILDLYEKLANANDKLRGHS